MTAPHFFAADTSGRRVTVDGDEARHAIRVLRLRPGERVTVSDGRGTVIGGVVRDAGRRLVVDVEERWFEPRARPSLAVLQAIPKRGKLDLVVQKLTELGVDSFVALEAARSVARWDAAKAASQSERLTAIAREAAKQSRRAWLPWVAAPLPLDEIGVGSSTLILHEEAAMRLREALPAAAPEAIQLVIGPEGGLTEDEVASLEARGATAVALGSLVLRTETAALAAAAVILAQYGRLG